MQVMEAAHVARLCWDIQDLGQANEQTRVTIYGIMGPVCIAKLSEIKIDSKSRKIAQDYN